jgi:glycine hydroxymethyltransferase
VKKETALIDYEEVQALATEHKPKLIIAGGSSYPRIIDFKKFKTIADSVGALFLVDMAHFAGLVATGIYPNPLEYADVVTSTTHKTLRGPRGGIVLTNNEQHAKKINSAVFPGLQGGPLMHVICAKAVAFGEALKPEFKGYIESVVENAKTLSDVMLERGLEVVSGGTDTHLVLVDLRPKKLTGKAAERSLENAGITCNKNGVPFDPESPFVTSGIRLGSPAGTSRGFGSEEFRLIGNLIGDVLDGLSENPDDNSKVENDVKAKVKSLCDKFPIYSSAI